MHKLSFLLPVFLLCAIAHAQSPVTYANAAAIPKTYFGQHIEHFASDGAWPSFAPKAVRIWDTPGIWNGVETANGVYNWSRLDATVSADIARGGTDLLYVLGNPPTWASSNPTAKNCAEGIGACYPPSDLTQTGNTWTSPIWSAWVTSVVSRYCGRITNYELWNEFDGKGFWSGTTAQMAGLAQIAYPIVHNTSVCPSAASNKLLSPSISSLSNLALLESFLSMGGGVYVDGIAYHQYPNTPNDPEFYTASFGSLSAFNSGASFSAANGTPLPIWDTEFSASGGSAQPTNVSIPFMARTYLTGWALGVQRHYWYAFDNSTFGTMWVSGSGETALARAFAIVQNWMVGSSERCTRYSDGVWVCALTNGKTTNYAVWSVNGAGFYTVPKGIGHAADLYGGTTAVEAGTKIALSGAPVLLTK